MIDQSSIDRFWNKVNLEPISECWNWVGGINARGYGNFWINGKIVSAHRVAWEIYNLCEVPKGMWVLHKCDNKKCCNPCHLYIGTASDNMMDSIYRDKFPKDFNQGENNPSAKLSKEDVIEIRRLYETGKYSQMELSRMYGLNPTYAHSIIRRKKWNF